MVDPEWLASNSEEARALREAKGKANKAWRVLHRVTYVERPALMGFGRDVRQLPAAESNTEIGNYFSGLELKHQDMLLQFNELKTEQQELKYKVDQILNALQNPPTQNS